MGAKKYAYTVCVQKLTENGGTAHNHFGGYGAYNDFEYKAASYIVDEGIETVVTLFADKAKLIPAYAIGKFECAPDGSVSVWLEDASAELTDDEMILELIESALQIQISRIGKSGGRVPKGAIAYVMQKKARFPKHIQNVKEAASNRVIHEVFERKLLDNNMGMAKLGEVRKKKRKMQN